MHNRRAGGAQIIPLFADCDRQERYPITARNGGPQDNEHRGKKNPQPQLAVANG